MRVIIATLLIIISYITTCAAGNSKILTFSVDKKPVFTLQLHKNWTSEINGGKTSIDPGKFEAHIQIWNIPKASTVKDAVPIVPEIIKGDVTDFKKVKTESLTVAGSKGKHIIGTGTEADDGDPSNAEVFLFSVGDKVFLLCAHGEGTGAAKARSSILEMLATLKKL